MTDKEPTEKQSETKQQEVPQPPVQVEPTDRGSWLIKWGYKPFDPNRKEQEKHDYTHAVSIG